MSNYTKTTDFDVKDSLPSGDTGKIIRGSEFEVEFENIEVAIASKADSLNTVLTGNTSATNLSVTGNTTLGNAATDTVTVNADFSSDLLPSADATYDLGAVGSEWQDLYITGTANIDNLSCGTASFSGDLAVDTDTLFVDVSADRVGVNTSSPSEALEINGNLKFSDGAARTIEGALNQNLIINSLGNLTGEGVDLRVNGTSVLLADFTGNVGIGTNSPLSPLVVSNAGASGLEVLIDNGLFQPATLLSYDRDALVFEGLGLRGSEIVSYIDNTERMRIASSGNVGIGTSSPSAKLEVEGANAAGDISIKVQNTDATANSRAVISYETQNGTWTLGSNRSGGFVLDTPASGEALRVTNDKNVGIGTSSPNSVLHIVDDPFPRVTLEDGEGTNDKLLIDQSSGVSSFTAWNNTANGVIDFKRFDGTTTSNSVRIDSFGSVGIGTTVPVEKLHVHGDALIGDASPDANLYLFKRFDGTSAVKFKRNTAGTPIDASVSCDGNENLVFDWNLDGLNAACLFKSNSTERLRIEASGKVGIGVSTALGGILTLPHQESISFHDASGLARKVLEFDTGELKHGSAGAGLSTQTFFTGGTERLRIDSSGNLLVGTDAANTSSAGHILYPTGENYLLADGTSSNQQVRFYRNVDATAALVGSIATTGTSTAYNTSSDVRLKENITDAPQGNVDALQVRSFDWKADGSHQEYGFIAQELEAVAPYAVTKGETADDMWGVDYSKLVPMLVKEIQDLKARIATLEAN